MIIHYFQEVGHYKQDGH